jgi:hypothetical protein
LKNQENFVHQEQIEFRFLDGPARMLPCRLCYSGSQIHLVCGSSTVVVLTCL